MNQVLLDKEREGILTEEDLIYYRRNIRKMDDNLYEHHIKAYGVSLAKDVWSKGGSGIPMNDFDDIVAGLALAFVENINLYNPFQSKPTTFFKPKFLSVIEHHKANKLNISQHYSHNKKAIIDATMYYHRLGVDNPTPDMIQKKSGLSVKVYNKTLSIIESARTLDIDSRYDVGDDLRNPETIVIQKQSGEKIESLINDFLEELPEEERDIFLAHFDEYGEAKDYQQQANDLGLPVNRVRHVFAKIQRALQNNPEISEAFCSITKKLKKIPSLSRLQFRLIMQKRQLLLLRNVRFTKI